MDVAGLKDLLDFAADCIEKAITRLNAGEGGEVDLSELEPSAARLQAAVDRFPDEGPTPPPPPTTLPTPAPATRSAPASTRPTRARARGGR